MAAPKGFLVVPVGFNPDGDLRSLELDADDNLKVVIGDTGLSALLTELETKLETADLDLDAFGALGIIFTAQDLDVEITQTAPADLRVGPSGWTSGAWQKNPLVVGYSGDKTQYILELDAAAGLVQLVSDTVPAGEIWEVQAINARNMINNPTKLELAFVANGTSIILETALLPGANVYLKWYGKLILSEGDYVIAFYSGTVLNDNIDLAFHAMRIDIDQ